MGKPRLNLKDLVGEETKDFMEIMPFHTMRMLEGVRGAAKDALDRTSLEIDSFQSAWARTLLTCSPMLAMNLFVGGMLRDVDGEDLFDYVDRKNRQMSSFLALRGGEFDKEIEKEFGYQFDDGQWVKFAETPRIELWMVRDYSDLKDKVPLIMIPPMVLNPGVLAWEKGRSFVHYLSERDIPVGVIINKDIMTNIPVQDMTMEEHIMDVREVCAEAGRFFGDTQVIMGGYCQGAECSLRALATGKLKGVASFGLIGVGPIDPTDVGTLYDNYHNLPASITLDDACITLPSGRKVIHGDKMKAVIEYGNTEANNAWSQMFRELSMCEKGSPSPSALKIWYWLNRTNHLPYSVIQLTNLTYQHPITDGVYGYELFGERPDLKKLGEFGINSLFVGTAENDTLVREEASIFLVSLLRNIIDVHPCQYNKGHLGIVRDCVMPGCDEPLDGYSHRGQEGPVLWYRNKVKRVPLDA